MDKAYPIIVTREELTAYTYCFVNSPIKSLRPQTTVDPRLQSNYSLILHNGKRNNS